MDGGRFDALARRWGAVAGRRGVLGGLAAGTAAVLGLGGGAAAKHRDDHRPDCARGKTACPARDPDRRWACRDLERNRRNCGACARACRRGERCRGGRCVPADRRECRADAECPPPRGGSAACVEGRCVAACPKGERACGPAPGACRECCFSADCPVGQTCTEPTPPTTRAVAAPPPGRCVVPCPPDRRCGTAAAPVCCAAGETCVGAGDVRACCPSARLCGTAAGLVCCPADRACAGRPPNRRCVGGAG
jgi:hypothetical protein